MRNHAQIRRLAMNSKGKYLVIAVGYQSLAIPIKDAASAAPILAILADASVVDSDGYGEKKVWFVTDASISFRFVDEILEKRPTKDE
jgi:hypothetical protein